MAVILAFDTAMSGCSVAVADDAGGRCAYRAQAMARGQSELLVPMIEDVMTESGVPYDALDAVVTTIGPGAFTGLRIGLSAARAYGLALGCPVYGLTTTAVIAAMFAADHKGQAHARVWTILETKRRDFYAQLFDEGGRAISEAVAESGDALCALMKFGDHLIGDGAERFLRECAGPQGVRLVEGYDLPDPRVMVQMAQDDLRAPERTMLREAAPLYLRGAGVSKSKQVIRAIDDLSRL